MVRLYVCWREGNGEKSAIEQHRLTPDAQMPYVTQFPFPVRDFLYRADTDVAWTSAPALRALDAFAEASPVAFSVDCAFLRMGARGCTAGPARHAGLAFGVGRALPPMQEAHLREAALQSGLFTHVSLPYQSGRGVRVSCGRGWPALIPGAAGPYVFALQDALLCAGLFTGALTGEYGVETARAVRRLQAKCRLAVTGRMDGAAWRRLVTLTKPAADATIGARGVGPQ